MRNQNEKKEDDAGLRNVKSITSSGMGFNAFNPGAILSFTAFCRGKVCKGREELDEALLDREGGRRSSLKR